MTRQHKHKSPRKAAWRERAFGFGGLAAAAIATPALLFLSMGADFIGRLWFTAIAWTVMAAIAHALWCGFRHGDWSTFCNYEFPDDGDAFDWSTQTGAYACMRIAEDHERLMREVDV